MASCIPIVDLLLDDGVLEDGGEVPSPSGEVAAAVCAACRDVGFLYVRQHGLRSSTVSTLLGEAREFFGRNEDEKRKVARHRWNEENSQRYRGYFPIEEHAGATSVKEGLDVGPLWEDSESSCVAEEGKHGIFRESNVALPPSLSGLQAALTHYHESASRLGCFLMRCIAVGLGLGERHFDHLFVRSVSTLRLLRYPPVPKESPSGLSCSEHTDSGIVTILWQDEQGGLQVDAGGEWVDVVPREGTFVVNLGDLLARWTGGMFKATLHRVKKCRAERMSMPFFFEPSCDSVIAPLPIALPEAGFEEIVYGDWLWEKIEREFDEFK